MSDWTLPGYVIEELLGFGSSGGAWRARVVSTGEPVALKRIALGSAVPMRTVHTGAAVLAALDHPHLVRLHELVPTGDAMVLVLDLAAGGTLAELVHARGRITPGEVITALAPVGAAVAYAHSAGGGRSRLRAQRRSRAQRREPLECAVHRSGDALAGRSRGSAALGENTPVRSTPTFIIQLWRRGVCPVRRGMSSCSAR